MKGRVKQGQAEIQRGADRDREKAERAEAGRDLGPPATEAYGEALSGETACSAGLSRANAPIYLHGPESKSFLRAACGATRVQQVAVSGLDCSITVRPPRPSAATARASSGVPEVQGSSFNRALPLGCGVAQST